MNHFERNTRRPKNFEIPVPTQQDAIAVLFAKSTQAVDTLESKLRDASNPLELEKKQSTELKLKIKRLRVLLDMMNEILSAERDEKGTYLEELLDLNTAYLHLVWESCKLYPKFSETLALASDAEAGELVVEIFDFLLGDTAHLVPSSHPSLLCRQSLTLISQTIQQFEERELNPGINMLTPWQLFFEISEKIDKGKQLAAYEGYSNYARLIFYGLVQRGVKLIDTPFVGSGITKSYPNTLHFRRSNWDNHPYIRYIRSFLDQWYTAILDPHHSLHLAAISLLEHFIDTKKDQDNSLFMITLSIIDRANNETVWQDWPYSVADTIRQLRLQSTTTSLESQLYSKLAKNLEDFLEQRYPQGKYRLSQWQEFFPQLRDIFSYRPLTNSDFTLLGERLAKLSKSKNNGEFTCELGV